MTIEWKEEARLAWVLEACNVLCSHFGYVAISTAAYLFKLAVVATLASYSAFLCATLVGGLITYFPTRFIMWALECMRFDTDTRDNFGILTQCTLSPMVGAYALNLALGWSLPLMPMLAVGVVGYVVGVVLLVALDACQRNQQKKPPRTALNANSIFITGQVNGTVEKNDDMSCRKQALYAPPVYGKV